MERSSQTVLSSFNLACSIQTSGESIRARRFATEQIREPAGQPARQ
jgi:hypothetical protein